MSSRFFLIIFTFYIFVYFAFAIEVNNSLDDVANILFEHKQTTATSRVVSDRNPEFDTFSQKLDHLEDKPENQQFWNQRYIRSDAAFDKDSGSVILSLGGEGPISKFFLFFGFFPNWAVKYKALILKLEHRFYGQSLPTPDLSIRSLKYLTVAQALADAAYFITEMKIRLNLTARNKWIVIGGSYPGTLAAWMQRNYPHLVDVAVASSATFPTKLFMPEYYESVSETLDNFRPGCTKNIKQATDELSKMIKHDCQGVSEKFNIKPLLNCDNEMHVVHFSRLLALNFGVKVQDNMREQFQLMCDKMIDASGGRPIDRLAASISINSTSEGIFVDLTIKTLKNKSWGSPNNGMRQWIYQLCTELGWPPTSDSKKQPFGHYFNSKSWFNTYCKGIFSPKFNKKELKKNNKKLIEEFGGLDSEFSRTAFTVGTMDPWKFIQMKKNNKINKVIEIKGASHCEDLKALKTTDPNLIKGVDELTKYVDELLVDSFEII